MDLLFFKRLLLSPDGSRCQGTRKCDSQDEVPHHGERGEIILALVITLLTASLILAGLFWLNRHFEKKTKDHLNGFQKNWNELSHRYQD